jgi:hypothetical protein
MVHGSNLIAARLALSLKKKLKTIPFNNTKIYNSRLEPFLVAYAIKRGHIKINNVNNFTYNNYTKLYKKYAHLFTPGRLHMQLRHENFNRNLNGFTQRARAIQRRRTNGANHQRNTNTNNNNVNRRSNSPRKGLVN